MRTKKKQTSNVIKPVPVQTLAQYKMGAIVYLQSRQVKICGISTINGLTYIVQDQRTGEIVNGVNHNELTK